jgi:hypothetical protein
MHAKSICPLWLELHIAFAMKTREKLQAKSVHTVPLHAPSTHRTAPPARDPLPSIIPPDDDYMFIHQLKLS